MPSSASQQLISRFESMNMKALMTQQFKTGVSTGGFDSPEPPAEVARVLTVEKRQFNQCNLFRLRPKTEAGKKQILYIHGGGYVENFSLFHWQFLTKLALQMKCAISTPDYPLAHQAPFPAAYNLVIDLYKDLINEVDPQNLILMGDSAGAGLCLALAQKMRDEDAAQPAEIVLLSPWLDITMSNPEITAIDPSDPFLSIEGCVMAGKIYAGANDPAHPAMSPINGTFHDLARLTIFAGSRDILAADARKLKGMLEAQRVAFNYNEFEGMFHVWMLFDLPESQEVILKIAELAS